MMFIPEEKYQEFMRSMPIFCVDFLIRCGNKNLLIKRTEEPVKGVYWVIGGRLRFKENIDQLVARVQTREIGRYFSQRKLIGFSNYFFPDVPDARATHTPTLLYLVEVNEMFTPNVDSTHSDFMWTKDLPYELMRQTEFLVPLGELSQ